MVAIVFSLWEDNRGNTTSTLQRRQRMSRWDSLAETTLNLLVEIFAFGLNKLNWIEFKWTRRLWVSHSSLHLVWRRLWRGHRTQRPCSVQKSILSNWDGAEMWQTQLDHFSENLPKWHVVLYGVQVFVLLSLRCRWWTLSEETSRASSVLLKKSEEYPIQFKHVHYIWMDYGFGLQT